MLDFNQPIKDFRILCKMIADIPHYIQNVIFRLRWGQSMGAYLN